MKLTTFLIAFLTVFTCLKSNQSPNFQKNPDYLSAMGNIYIDSPEMTNSGRFEINISKRDSLSMVVKGPFGIVAAKLFLTKDTAIFYNSMENLAICVNPKTYDMSGILGFPISLAELIDVFTAHPFAKYDAYSKDDSSRFVAAIQKNLFHKILFFENSQKIKNSLVYKDTVEFFNINYTDYKSVNDSTDLPLTINANFSETKTKVDFEIEEWNSPKKPFKSLSFTLPEGVKILVNNKN